MFAADAGVDVAAIGRVAEAGESSAPRAQNTAGLEAHVAPFAVSMAIFQPRSEPAGRILTAASMYDSRTASPGKLLGTAAVCARRVPRNASIAASSASVSLQPSGPKNFTPLSDAGLCDAVIATPSAAPPARPARETAGVGTCRPREGLAPPLVRPAPIARASEGPEALVSKPMTTLPEADAAALKPAGGGGAGPGEKRPR